MVSATCKHVRILLIRPASVGLVDLSHAADFVTISHTYLHNHVSTISAYHEYRFFRDDVIRNIANFS